MGTHYKRLTEALLMSTHNICFCGEIRKILCGYPLLSVAMIAAQIMCTWTKKQRCLVPTLLPSNKNVSQTLRKVSVGILSTNTVRNQLNVKSDRSTPLLSNNWWTLGSFSWTRSFNTLCQCKRQENIRWLQLSLTLVLQNPDIPCFCKQCRSRSVGFWRSQLIWIWTVCQ